jgi:hypothetical protein
MGIFTTPLLSWQYPGTDVRISGMVFAEPVPPSPPLPPYSSCIARVTKQISHHPCTLNVSFGCSPTNHSEMWTSSGCRADFELNGVATACVETTESTTHQLCNKPPLPPPTPHPPKPPPPQINASTVTVMVFGDSWGSLGPGWHEIQDMFNRHNVSAVVRSAARGGTQACQWAGSPTSMVKAAQKLFPERPHKGPDFVWYTLGGNDFANHGYQECSRAAKSIEDEKNCTGALFTHLVSGCTRTLLEHYWKVYPDSKVMQCGYDVPCESGGCIRTDDSRVPFCGSNVTCMDEVTLYWQSIYVDALHSHYNSPGGAPAGGNYTGLNILGTVQASGGVKGASTGNPVIGVGSPCELETMCVHPTHGKAGATAVGEAFWRMYFSKHLPLDAASRRS